MVDIIIPAYNCKDTLPRALSSIMAQTKKEKCIVTVVDDCSTEDLEPIIDDFKKYIRINYIKLKENLKYPGLVRQVGIDNSIGHFIMFLDSDDVLEPTAVEHLHNEMMKTDRDVIMGYFYCQEANGDFVTMKEDRSTWLHGNIYRRSFLKKNNIKFCTGYNEDGAFNTQCYMLSDKIGIFQKPIMYWLHNKNSITRSQTEFSIRYGDHFVSTLNFAYQNIFSHNGRTKKTIKNMGTHWAMFYKILNEIREFDEEAFREVEDLLDIQIALFVKDLNIYNFTDHEKVYFKQGFTKGLQKYCLSDKPHWVTPETFLSMYSTGISLSVVDFLIRGDE